MVNTTLLPLSYYFGIFGSLNNNPIRSSYFSAYVTRLILEFFFSSSGINLGTSADQTLYLVSTFDVLSRRAVSYTRQFKCTLPRRYNLIKLRKVETVKPRSSAFHKHRFYSSVSNLNLFCCEIIKHCTNGFGNRL